MFQRLLRDRDTRISQLKAATSSSKAAATTLAADITALAVEQLNSHISQIYSQQQEIERVSSHVRAELGALKAHLAWLASAVEQLRLGLKEAGDLELYMGHLHHLSEGLESQLMGLLQAQQCTATEVAVESGSKHSQAEDSA